MEIYPLSILEEENCHVPYLVKIKRKTKLIPGTGAFQNEVYTNLEVLYREFLPIAYQPLFNKHLHEMMAILCCYYIFYLFEVLYTFYVVPYSSIYTRIVYQLKSLEKEL